MNKTLKDVLRTLPYIVVDVFCINFSVILALLLRFDMSIHNESFILYLTNFLNVCVIYTVASIFLYALLRVYSSLWLHINSKEIVQAILASIFSVCSLMITCEISNNLLPRTTYVIVAIFNVVLLLSVRSAVYHFQNLRKTLRISKNRKIQNLMVIGAGEVGSMLIKECNSAKLRLKEVPVCVIDDDESKVGKYINGVKIVGDRDFIIQAAEQYRVDEIIFAIPSASAEERAKILNICKETGCVIKIVPGYYQFINGDIKLAQTRKVKVEDLLGRESVKVNTDKIMQYVENKTVIVTGGGGSIGSELCRQIAKHNPKLLIIFDVYENNAYEIQQELKRNHTHLNLLTLIGSVRDSERMNQIFAKYKPDIVYHAAAHKHVPLMEDSPNESIKNNVFGTYKTAKAAHDNGVSRFVLISTDKAVNPTNIMGASKRMCEMVIQYFNTISDTDFVAVRFGNVLGSNGSVIPLFEQQIEKGGPVTVTDPNIIRYFMTIPEAVSLVIQAGAMAKGGEIFVLDMGKPVKILDLAINMIKLSGYIPYVDIDIQFTGLRPGEKLYEELLMSEEGMTKTDNDLIYIGKPIDFDTESFIDKLDYLKDNMYNDGFDVREEVKKIVTTYIPDRDNKVKTEKEGNKKDEKDSVFTS